MSTITVQSIKDQTRNFQLLYLDSFLSTFPGIAATFAGAFAVRLGATNTWIALMGSIPSLVIIIVSIPFGRILQKTSRKLSWVMSGTTLFRFCFIFAALAPWIHNSFITPGIYFVLIWVLKEIPTQFYNIGNVGMMIELIPENRRAAVFTNRNLIGSAVTIGGVFLAGQWLSRMPFPINYQTVFIVAAVVGFFSLFTWLSMRFPPVVVKENLVDRGKTSIMSLITELVRIFKERPVFTQFMINIILLNIGIWTVGPLYILYTVRQLQASDAWVGLWATTSTACSLIGWLLVRCMIEMWGDSVTLRRLVLLLGIYPIAVGMTSSLTLILIYGGIMNLFGPGYLLGVNNSFYKVLPIEHRDESVAIYNTVTSIGPSIFPLVGVAMAGYFGFSPTFIVCGILAVLGALSFWIWRIRIN